MDSIKPKPARPQSGPGDQRTHQVAIPKDLSDSLAFYSYKYDLNKLRFIERSLRDALANLIDSKESKEADY